LMGKNFSELKIITAHLGNGCSMAAIKDGKSIDTTMGFTPLEGLLMGTRCGDIDPSIITFLMSKEGLTLFEVNTLLNKHSGLMGVSGVSSDMREILSALEEGNKKAKFAFDIFCYRIKKYLGSYSAAMGGLDAFVFTGGIGENSAKIRNEVCSDLEFLGIEIDNKKNNSKCEIISTDSSKVKVFCLSTNEELVIATDTEKIVSCISK